VGEAFRSVETAVLLLATVIVAAPLVAERLRVPGLVGLIAGGVIVGPHVIGWVAIDGLIAAIGALGLLYLMYLAGLGFDLSGFSRNRNGAIAYGLLGFAVPFALALVSTIFFLEYAAPAAALVGAMWASNTLVAYPEVQAAGLTDNRAVGVAVSAGVIADIISLTVLAGVTSTFVLEAEAPEITPSNPDPTLPLWIGLPLLVGLTLWALPRITAWFFTQMGHTRTIRFAFVLAGMGAGAVVAKLGGVEGLVGAFLAGLGMNRMIPSGGPLMSRIEFFGEALLVPAFLVSVGLSIDPGALFDLDTLRLGLLFVAIVVTGKTAAALVVGGLSRMTAAEIGIMSTLSFGQAASTLAISQVGVRLGIFEQDVVNAAVVAIVATAFLTSIGTRMFARRIDRPAGEQTPLGRRVLVDARAEDTELDGLMRFADAIAVSDNGVVIPFAIDEGAQRAVAEARVTQAVECATRLGMDTEGTVRIGGSFATDSLNLLEEHDGSLLVLRWEGPRFPADFVLTSQIDTIGARSLRPAVAAHLTGPWQRLIVATGDLDAPWHRDDANLAFQIARRLSASSPTPVAIFTTQSGEPSDHLQGFPNAEVTTYTHGSRMVLEALRPGDLLLIPPHVVRSAAGLGRWALTRHLQGVSIAVIAGPGRLSVTAANTRQSFHGAVTTRR
jgi:Kef-type K+ transport system membrane component KefB